jgi:hypothetical protein
MFKVISTYGIDCQDPFSLVFRLPVVESLEVEDNCLYVHYQHYYCYSATYNEDYLINQG